MYRAVHNGSQSDRHRARRFVRGLPCRCACMAIFGMCTMHVILTWWPRVADLTSGLNATRSPSNAPPPSRPVHGARHGALFVQGRLVITSRRIDAAAGSCRRIDAPPPPVAPPPLATRSIRLRRAPRRHCASTSPCSNIFRESERERGVIRRGNSSHLRRVPRLQCREEFVRGHQRSSVVIRDHQSSSELIRAHQSSSELIRAHQWSSVVISGHQKSSEVSKVIRER